MLAFTELFFHICTKQRFSLHPPEGPEMLSPQVQAEYVVSSRLVRISIFLDFVDLAHESLPSIVIAIYSAASKTPNGPVLTAASIFIVTGVAMLGLPVETQGKTA